MIKTTQWKPFRLMWMTTAMLVGLLIQLQEVAAPHVCFPNDLTAFCLITRQFKEIVMNTYPRPYPQFKEIIDKFPDPDKFYAVPHYGGIPYPQGAPEDHLSMYTYQDYCELYKHTSAFDPANNRPPINSKNPYKLEVTEIHVDKVRLHNWLHIRIYSDKSLLAQAKANGKIKMAFLIVHDKQSYAVGDFNHHLPCGSDCNCKHFNKPKAGFPQCKQGSHMDHVPCMFTSEHVVTHPGQMMFYDENGVEEIHATWHFAQSQFEKSFVTELHFKALVIEDLDSTKMTGRTSPHSRNQIKLGIFGFTPVYPILLPTTKTLGGWDFFRRRVYHQKQIECHKPIDPAYYSVTNYPNPYKNKDPNRTVDDLTEDLSGHFGAIVGARVYDYGMRDEADVEARWKAKEAGTVIPPVKRPAQLYYGTSHSCHYPKSRFPNRCMDKFDNGQRRSTKHIKEQKDKLALLTSLNPNHFWWERCVCPKQSPTVAPEDMEIHPTQIQGRKAHALQMIIAWLMLVPFGIFVSRYYKETYAKVFFLHEYWWFSMHVLSMIAAAMFIYGGIYSVEIKRMRPISWKNHPLLIHNVMGIAAIGLFTLQCFLGFFRIRNVQYRIVQIFLHWFFGNFQYGLALACMLSSAFIVSGCLPCAAFFYLVLLIFVQACIFTGMELHMRGVDKLLNLKPPRSYLPPPVMRVFHEPAPESRWRIHILFAYACFLVVSFVVVHMNIKYNDEGISCFRARRLENDAD